MSGRYKFRVWHRNKKIWCDETTVYDDGSWSANIILKEGMTICGYDDSECVLMQCTGLQDKNGRDIYEGDILLIPQEATMSNPMGESECCRVDMVGGAFGYWLPSGFESFLGWYGDVEMIDDAQIIGNIWETPEFVE